MRKGAGHNSHYRIRYVKGWMGNNQHTRGDDRNRKDDGTWGNLLAGANESVAWPLGVAQVPLRFLLQQFA